MRSLVLAALTAAAFALASCGEESSVSPAALIAAAIENTEDAKSYRSSFSVRSDLEGQEMVGNGDNLLSNADSTRARGTMTFTFGQEDPIRVEMILIGEDAYMRSDDFDLPEGKRWMHVRDETLAQQSLTPDEMVEFLRDAPEVEESGRETIRGSETVHLRGPVDVAELAQRADGPVSEMFDKQPDLARRTRMRVDAWIAEEEQTLERVSVRISVDGEPGSQTIAGDILDEGVSLASVKAPPQGTVVEEKDVVR